jgi:hypothetical protein
LSATDHTVKEEIDVRKVVLYELLSLDGGCVATSVSRTPRSAGSRWCRRVS